VFRYAGRRGGAKTAEVRKDPFHGKGNLTGKKKRKSPSKRKADREKGWGLTKRQGHERRGRWRKLIISGEGDTSGKFFASSGGDLFRKKSNLEKRGKRGRVRWQRK